MHEPPPLESAARRLAAALDLLDDVVEQRLMRERNHAALEAQVQALGVDRSRLAAELDHSRHRSTNLETTNRDVARRLNGAMETIRHILDQADR